MSNDTQSRAVDLGAVTPARSRHAGRRSGVALAGGLAVVGTAAGDVRAYDRRTLEKRWEAGTETEQTSVVSVASVGESVVVGERGPDGAVRCYDAEGETQWRYATAADVGEPQKASRFFLPFVVDIATGGNRLYVAARRYERDGEHRSFVSVVYAFDEGGDVVWTYRTDASAISLDAGTDRLAVAYNRCPGTHRHGLVVLEAATGAVRYDWDAGTDGSRRVGDVSLVDDGVALTSHGDYRGYRLERGGAERWCVDLATPREAGDETLYAYPNHVHASTEGVVFVTGNTYATDGRETESLHPDEHTIFGYTPDGERAWTATAGGFASGVGVDGDRVAVPGAQHFRTRDASVHGLRYCHVESGLEASLETAGIVTAVSLDGREFAAVTEPVVYHDDGAERGTYRLRLGELSPC
jgi:outer membrane protein assembly factor BamB